MESGTILTPITLWKDFNDNLPLKESYLSEQTIDGITYSEVYFSGREVSQSRVRIFGVFASVKTLSKKHQKGGLLILPDCNQSINYEIINLYVKQGYSVLMIDYRGESDLENWTKYPEEINYANYSKSGETFYKAEKSAKETCWYEWVSVARFGISFLKSMPDIDKVGVLGVKNGSNIGWMLCGTDQRVDCFVALFGAGWLAYRGVYKYSDTEITMDEERFRFLAGVESQAYAQYVKCPILYLNSTNNQYFDCDRACDTLARLKPSVSELFNYAPRLRDSLNSFCEKDVELFLSKYILNKKVFLPEEPKVTLAINNKNIMTTTVTPEQSENLKISEVNVYVCEGEENPAFRNWEKISLSTSKGENSYIFSYSINGNSSFLIAFAEIKYKNGATVSSKFYTKKLTEINKIPNKLIYSSNDCDANFSIYSAEKFALGGLFFNEDGEIIVVEGANQIKGVTSKHGLVSYKVNRRWTTITENTLIKFDVFCTEYAEIKLSLILPLESCVVAEYSLDISVKGAKTWQNIVVKCADFKTKELLPIKEFDKVSALKIDAYAKCVFNNILVL